MTGLMRFLLLCPILLGCSSALAAIDNQSSVNDVDIVWASSDGLRMEIYYSQRTDGVWQDPVRVTDDHYTNLYPVVDRDSTGKRWIFWTAYDNGRMEIHYSTGQGDEWQASEVLAAEKKTNISPSAVVDKEDRVWVAWSANDGELDDIMYAYFHDNSWSDPAPVHAENDAADMLPVIAVDGAGIPAIDWYTINNGEKVIVSSRWIENKWTEPKFRKNDADSTAESEERTLELPPFLGQYSSVFIRVY